MSIWGSLEHCLEGQRPPNTPVAAKWFHHVPPFMDRICLLVVPVETEVDLQTA